MPAAVSSWINKKSLKEVNQVHHDLMATYSDDIAKYRGRVVTERLDEVMVAVPKFLGEKFVYTQSQSLCSNLYDQTIIGFTLQSKNLSSNNRLRCQWSAISCRNSR